ncbi:MAG TPA: hypothetical protein VIN59_03070 [Alphaproteobacteria bacterium]
MTYIEPPSFPAAISWQGDLSRDFRDYAGEIFEVARTNYDGNKADHKMARGRFPDRKCFSPIPLPEAGSAQMRTRLIDFTPNDHHSTILHRNNHLSLKLHTEFNEAMQGDSEHFVLHRAYERVRYNRYISALDTTNLLQGHSQAPHMQAFLLDIYDPYGYMMASVIFQLGNKSAYCSYHFYRTDARDLYIGRYSILATMMTLKQAAGCKYFYIGVFQASNDHYRWKSFLKPAEVKIGKEWLPLNSRTGNILRKERHARKAKPAL